MTTLAVQSRGRILGSLTTIRKFTSAITKDTAYYEIEVRLQRLETLWNEFYQYEDQIALALATNTNLPLELKQEEFEVKFFEVKAILLKSLQERKPPVGPATSNTSLDTLLDQQRVFLEGLADRTQAINDRTINQSSDSFKLPRVHIGKFTGEYEAWPAFYDLYTSSVHNVEGISKVHKFQILRGSLLGPPLDIIKNFLITETNYSEAWEKLVMRYNKKRPILNSYIDRFINQTAAVNGSVRSLRQITDTSDEILRGIKALGGAAENRDPWLIQILLKKLDEETRLVWAKDTIGDDFPTIHKFLDFLNNQCYSKESAVCDKKPGTKGVSVVKSMYAARESVKCPCCQRPHYLYRCLKFKGMPVQKRRTLVNQLGVCYNCLREGHSVSTCPTDYSCRICKVKHHTFLHLESESLPSNSQSPISTVIRTEQSIGTKATPIEGPSTNTTNVTNTTTNSKVSLPITATTTKTALNATISRSALLPTALVYVRDSAGKNHLARALLDSGSQSTFITEGLVNKLNIQRSASNVRVSGISGLKGEVTKGLVKLTLQSRFTTNDCFHTEAFILTKLTAFIPQSRIDTRGLDDVNKHRLQLADPTYYKPSKIDILLGADIFFELLKADKLRINDHLIAQSTSFGWVIAGNWPNQSSHSTSYSTVIQDNDTHRILEQFWKLEEIPIASSMSEVQLKCEKHYVDNYQRCSEGRYVVRLPFETNSGELGHSRSAAVNRLLSMERRFRKDPILKEQYVTFMNGYLQLNHMEEIPPDEVLCDDAECFYLPHHAVIKNDSTSTKLRVVFDGSCKSGSGISLNEKLLVGPTIQKDLISVLMMFRKHAIAFSSDVEKMFRQVKINRLDQDFQRIVWRSTASEPMKTFRLTTVTYGTSCAPFLAIRTLHQIAEDNRDTYPIGSVILKKDFYVDDCLSGADSLEEAECAVREICEVLSKNGLTLRKWRSNSPNLMKNIPMENRDENSLNLDDCSGTVKTLGLQWNPSKDTFSYKIFGESKPVVSKREMLSQIARVFDPLGWISPVIIVFKVSLQRLWIRKLNWDDPLPKDLAEQWQTNQTSLRDLKQIEVPRFLKIHRGTTGIQLHGFCDASESAYGAVIYIRVTNSKGMIDTRLVVSKTKVAPIKQISLPRLELCGAVLLSRLMKFTRHALEIEDVPCWAWTDSEIVLAWLSDVPRRWKCFIGNRTAEILEVIPRMRWGHVTSKENPADVASRGVTPKQLVGCSQWWNGPQWLSKRIEDWPKRVKTSHTSLDERTVSLTAQVRMGSPHLLRDLFGRIESFSKIGRVLAKVLRVIKLYRSFDTVELVKRAENACIRWVQAEEFEDEIHDLKRDKAVNPKSKLISLCPFIDQDGILRVGGRLENLQVSVDKKHPIILPKSHLLTDKIIREAHIRYLHPGPTLQISILRQRYWILNCRNAVRRQINNCVVCRRLRVSTSQQLMGNLPASRITPSRPFLHTGVDYAGPLHLKSRTGRGRIPIIKGYICIFICFATKAIHIELSHDMTSEAFISALRRFTARRGVPREISSDNGTNFVGAKRQLGELYHLYQQNTKCKSIQNFLLQNEIRFTFNPPSGPHFGGLWESGVKSIKHHLNRVTKGIVMTAWEMETLLVQIEGLLNSRPLCPLTDNIDSLDALTPAHFLIGEAITTIPEPSLDHITSNRLSRWQNVQARLHGFWRQWQTNYLHTLQQRRKWNRVQENIKIGDLVIIKEENLPPSKWSMGRVVILHPGNDGLVRVASLKTATGITKRPIVKLCKLFASDESS